VTTRTRKPKKNEQESDEESEEDNMTPEQAEEAQELAWEVLETARLSLEKHPDKSPTQYLLLADIEALLGDINRENNMLDDALADYQKCLEYTQKGCQNAADERRLSEAHYMLSLAYSVTGKLPEAEKHIAESQSLLKKYVASNKEVEHEMKDILVEMDAKLADIKDAEAQPGDTASTAATDATTSTTATDATTTTSTTAATTSIDDERKPRRVQVTRKPGSSTSANSAFAPPQSATTTTTETARTPSSDATVESNQGKKRKAIASPEKDEGTNSNTTKKSRTD